MKSGFWQLGLDPKDRPKTAFCIPNAHYQWTVLPFGLKVAPSLFQKAMTKIFEPILHTSLVYIDDVLLFSPDEESHKELLQQFYDICNKHGVMLSSRKSQIATKEVDFLGMHFTEGKYVPQPHIVEELPKFPDEGLTIKQIQQFLGILNYIRDFIPHVSKYTSKLSKMLRKNAPPWGKEQTEAVKFLKKAAQNPPPLKIPGDGKRILQTDASDHYWAAVLIEEIGGQKFYCGHASGQFKDAELHYHTTFKETLAVKYGIKKFDFHLRGHHFEVQIDNSSFPKMLDFKNKTPPNPQILRLKEWFSLYDFSVKHVQGSKNLIPDYLSRPKPPGKSIQMISSTNSYPLIMMNADPSSSSSAFSTRKKYFPPELSTDFLNPSIIRRFAEDHMFHYLALSLHKHGIIPKATWFHPAAPFLNIFALLSGQPFIEEDLWYLWCTTLLHNYPILFPTMKMIEFLENPENESSLLWNLLEWYQPLDLWKKNLHSELERMETWKLSKEEQAEYVTVAIIHRPYFQHPTTKFLWTQNQVRIWSTFPKISIFQGEDKPPFHQAYLIIQLHELNGTYGEVINLSSTCYHLKPMDIICFPLKEDPPTIHNHGEKVMPAIRSVTDKTLSAVDLSGPGHVIMQDAQDPYPEPSQKHESEEPEPMLFDDTGNLSDMNMSPEHEPIRKRWN